MVADALCQGSDLSMEARALRIDRAHHAAAVVAARRDGVEQRLVQCLDDGPQAVFQDPMELKGLAGGDALGFAAVRAGELVELQPLRGRADDARPSNPDHELNAEAEFVAPDTVVPGAGVGRQTY